MHVRSSLLLVVALLAAGCAGGGGEGEDPTATTPTPGGDQEVASSNLTLASPAFGEGEPMPSAHSCDGEGASPPLNVTGAPANATHLALVVVDPDVPVPEAPLQESTHWLVWNVPLANRSATFVEGEVPEGAVEGTHSAQGQGWLAPCPPPASNAHRYVFTAYALDGPLDLAPGASRAEVEAAMEGHVLAEANLTGTYQRQVA